MKHTEGPWNIYSPIDGIFHLQNKMDYAKEENDANERLIAAAPEMLEAVKLMLTEHYRVNEQLGQSKNNLTPGMKLAVDVLKTIREL